ncbi:MAG TPA: ABC transporter substrate-binding protein, partial [Solirubrobacterales bacterium]|nr:ABC transporter substrate-binding protein [Solirubrobacterales bacterium]
ATGCGSISASAGEFSSAEPGVLTVATSVVPSPGFWEGTPSHPTGGFEYELAREMAKRFGLERVKVVIVHFHRIVRGHLGGADLGIDLLTPTPEREEALEFSDPYLKTAPTVLVRAGTEVPDLKTAQELRWGAIQSTTFVETIEDSIVPESEPILYDGQQEDVAALEAGKIEATLLDLPLAVAVAEQSAGKLEAVAQLPDKEALAVALPKGSPNRQAVSSAIHAFTADGTIEGLLEEWVGEEAANAESEIPLLHTTLH